MRSKPRPTTGKRRLSDRRIQLAIGILIAGGALLGLVIPMSAMQFENHDSFCASCHTQDEQTFFDRSTASPATDLASFHAAKGAARCIDCHSGPGIVGRYIALTYGATDLVSFASGHYPQPAVQETPIGDGNCTKCHADVFNNKDFSNHFHAFLPRWRAFDSRNAARCVECHVSHDTVNDAGAAFLDRAAASAVCQKCHAMAGEG